MQITKRGVACLTALNSTIQVAMATQTAKIVIKERELIFPSIGNLTRQISHPQMPVAAKINTPKYSPSVTEKAPKFMTPSCRALHIIIKNTK